MEYWGEWNATLISMTNMLAGASLLEVVRLLDHAD